MTRIKKIIGHTSLARFLSAVQETDREIARVIREPYRYSSTHRVYEYNGRDIIIIESAQPK